MKTLNPTKPLHDEGGAFDLPSILVGVVVVGVLTAGVLASIFGVIPFAQDTGAKQDLSAITTAQGVNMANEGTYGDFASLASNNLLPAGTDPLKTDAKVTANGWGAAAKSPSGKVYLATNSATAPVDVTGQEACTPAALATPAIFNFEHSFAMHPPATLRPTGIYTWFVTAINPLGETIASDSPWQFQVDTTSNMRFTISAVPGATGYKVYRSETASPSDAKLLTTITAPTTFEDPYGKYGTVWNWTDDGSLMPGPATPPAYNTTGDAVPACVTVTDVASALASLK